jgi:gliding motility-associated-like protein
MISKMIYPSLKIIFQKIITLKLQLKLILFFSIVITLPYKAECQLIFEQDIVKGGVTAAGFSTARGSGSGSFDIYIEPGSTIKKAYLFTYSLGSPPNAIFFLNNVHHEFEETSYIMNVKHKNSFASPVKLYFKDITSEINPNLLNYDVIIPFQGGLPINWGYWTVFLYVVYENSSLSNTSYNILINNKDLLGYEDYSIFNLNSILPNTPFGFSIYTDRSGSLGQENNEIYINSNLIGINGGTDNVNSQFTFGGVKGHFYYQNNQLFGLDDDIPNNTMSGSDGLADISSFLTPNLNSFDFALKNINYPNNQSTHTNINLAYFLAYSTPCDTFSATLLTKDTTVCIGESVQLEITGGQKYKWLPSTGLSCDTCANPIASPLESTTYTVRIFNNDSCSKVYPVRVNISQPKPDTITNTISICGEDDGKINVGNIPLWRLSQTPITYTINGDTVQGPEISNISPGNKELKIIDANGCIYVDNLFIEEENITVSRIMYLSAEKGTAPLEITARGLLVNYISNHVFVWIVNGDTINTGNSPLNYTFDQPGEYELIHITYNQYPHCADTVKTIILVFPDFFAQIPNVFSPNADGINDAFEIKISNTQSISWQIKNRWGNLVSEGSKDLDSETQKLQLWNGENASDGVYFYTLTATDYNGKVYEKSGSVSLLR